MAFPAALSGFGSKKTKPLNTKTIIVDCGRLVPPTEDTYPQFHWPTLVKEQTGKSEGVNPLEDNEEYKKLESIAQKFEEKYGPRRDKKGRKIRFGKPEDYMDLGMGYDKNDPFIDDSEAYDELVPSTLTPIHGGFYINRGRLEYREVSDSEDDEEPGPRKKMPRLRSSSDSSSEESTKDAGETSHKAPRLGAISHDKKPSMSSTAPKDRATPNQSTGHGLKQRGRPRMTPEQKAAANIMRKAAGRKKPVEGVRGILTPERADSRITNVVDSVIAKSTPDSPMKQVADAVSSVVASLGADRSAPKGSTDHGTLDGSAPVVSAMFKVTKATMPVQAPITGIPANEGKEATPNIAVSSDQDVMVLESSLDRRARMIGKPPAARKSSSSSAPKATALVVKSEASETWPLPPQLEELSKEFAARVYVPESGQKIFSSRTDEVLRRIQRECNRLGLKKKQIHAVAEDLSSRTKVKFAYIYSRWEKVKGDSSAGQRATSATTVEQSKPRCSDVDFGSMDLQTLCGHLQAEIDERMPELEREHRKVAEGIAAMKLELIQTVGGEGDQKQKNLYTPRKKRLFKAIADKLWRRASTSHAVVERSRTVEEQVGLILEEEVVPLWPSGWITIRELLKLSKTLRSPETYSFARAAREKTSAQLHASVSPKQTVEATSVPRQVPSNTSPVTSPPRFTGQVVPSAPKNVPTSPNPVPPNVVCPPRFIGHSHISTVPKNITTVPKDITTSSNLFPTAAPKPGPVAVSKPITAVASKPITTTASKPTTTTASKPVTTTASKSNPVVASKLIPMAAFAPSRPAPSAAPKPVPATSSPTTAPFRAPAPSVASMPVASNQMRGGLALPTANTSPKQPKPSIWSSSSMMPQQLDFSAHSLATPPTMSFPTAALTNSLPSPSIQNWQGVPTPDQFMRMTAAMMSATTRDQGHPGQSSSNSWTNYHRHSN